MVFLLLDLAILAAALLIGFYSISFTGSISKGFEELSTGYAGVVGTFFGTLGGDLDLEGTLFGDEESRLASRFCKADWMM